MPSFIKDTTLTVAIRAVTLVVAFAATVVLARVLGPALNGSYNIMVLLVTVTSLLTAFGMQASIVYYGARNANELPALVGMSLAMGVIIGLAGGLVLVAATLIPAFAQYLTENGVPPGWLIWMIPLLPIVQINTFTPQIMRAAGQIGRYNLITLWQYFVLLVAAIIFLSLSTENLLEAAFGAFITSQTAGGLLSVIFALQLTGGHLRLDWAIFTRSFRYGLRLHPASVVQFLNYRLDLFLVGVFLPLKDVGAYATATLLAERLWEPPSAVHQVLLYQVSANPSNAAMMTARAGRVIMALMTVLCLTVVFGGYPFVQIVFGSSYLPSVSALIFLMPGVWALSLGKVLAAYMVGIGKPEIGTIASIVSLVATVTLDITLIQPLGIVGASLASSISYTLFTLIILTYFIRQTGLSFYEVVIMKQKDLTSLYNVYTKTLKRRLSG